MNLFPWLKYSSRRPTVAEVVVSFVRMKTRGQSGDDRDRAFEMFWDHLQPIASQLGGMGEADLINRLLKEWRQCFPEAAPA